MKKLLFFLFAAVIILFSFQCKKEHSGPVNITLWDKPLPVIQSYITGKWKLEYAIGGFMGMKYPARNNAYMKLTPSHIIIGNDSSGIVVDTTIVWEKNTDIRNRNTWLLSYHYSPGYIFPYHYIIEQVRNDTLIIADNAYDSYEYFYTKYR